MTCPLCLALTFASDDSLRALVRFQAFQLDRLTGGRYVQPNGVVSNDVGHVVEALLGAEDIWRKPPRVAAPRLIEGLAAAGIHLIPEPQEKAS